MKRTATAHWQGNLKEGKGIVSTESGGLEEKSYSYKTRFVEGEKGLNPEELLAAAHASCFTMQVAANLSDKGFKPKSLDTKATVTLEGSSITDVRLSITGDIKDITADEFSSVTRDAEKNCPISKTLKIPILSEAHLIPFLVSN